jgi:hypothetical protein
MSIARKTPGFFWAISILISSQVPATHAELATGTIVDPSSRTWAPPITRVVYKDWQEGVSLNQDTGDYVITYKNDNGNYIEVTFVPSTKISPLLLSKIKRAGDESAVRYEYQLKSDATSRQNISEIFCLVRGITAGSIVSPKYWQGGAYPNLQTASGGLRLSWKYHGTELFGGLAPGKNLTGFEVQSNDLPLVRPMEINGATPSSTWLGGAPGPDTVVGKRFNELFYNNFVTRLSAVPGIPNPNPFDAATILASLKTHLDQDLVAMKLVEPSLVSELDRWLEAAITAAKAGNTPALKASLKEARKLLKREYADVDDDRDEAGKMTARSAGKPPASTSWPPGCWISTSSMSSGG